MAAVRAALAALAGALLLLAGAEGLLVLAGLPAGAPPPGYEYLYVETRRPFYRRHGDRLRTARPRGQPLDLPQAKPEGVKRVFLVGGSVALPFERRLLAEALESREPGVRWQQWNMGMAGYSSAADLLNVRQALRLRPDAVVLLTGNNEAFAPPRWPALAPLWAKLARLRLAGLAQRLVPDPPPPLLMEPAFSERRLEANLRAMAREAKAAGVPVVFCTLPAALRDQPPSSGPFPGDERALAARHAWERGDAAAAERLLQGRSEPQALFLRARSLERLGRREEAARAYLAASEADKPGNRASPGRNALIRRVAAEEGQALADLEAGLRAVSRDGLPGAELLTDGCHWRVALYPHSAETIARALLGEPAPPPPAAPGPYDAQEWARVLSGAISLGALIPERDWSEEALEGLRRVRALDPRRFAAAVSSPEALESVLLDNGFVGPGQTRRHPEPVWSHVGEALRRGRDWQGAEAAFARARAAAPSRLRPRIGLAELAASRGDRAAAARLAAELAAEQPFWPELGARARAWAASGGGRQNAMMSASP